MTVRSLCSSAFCSAAAEHGYVRKPAGALSSWQPGRRETCQLVMLEHVRSPFWGVRAAQRLLEPLAVRFEADHLLRDPLDYLPAVGFQIGEVRRSKRGIVERLRAHKPADGS